MREDEISQKRAPVLIFGNYFNIGRNLLELYLVFKISKHWLSLT